MTDHPVTDRPVTFEGMVPSIQYEDAGAVPLADLLGEDHEGGGRIDGDRHRDPH